MQPDDAQSMRRVTVVLERWPVGLALGVRPTIVIEGRSQPTQWGEGTWLLPADRATTVGVFLHVRGVIWGRASRELLPTDEPQLHYRFGLVRGRFTS
jgi:hypothetical protein